MLDLLQMFNLKKTFWAAMYNVIDNLKIKHL